MYDIVIPRNNESEFIEIAIKLNYDELIFLYENEVFMEKNVPISNTKIKIRTAILANPKTVVRDMQKFKRKDYVVMVRSSPLDRTIIESDAADIIFGIETDRRKDFLHQRASGLNHILAKKLAENKMSIGFSISDILSAKNSGVILGRIQQNIAICKKYKVPIIVASFAEHPFQMRSFHDVRSLFTLLGMDINQQKIEDITFLG